MTGYFLCGLIYFYILTGNMVIDGDIRINGSYLSCKINASDAKYRM
jgi:hypothetical protein